MHCLYVIKKFYCVRVATGCRDLFTHVGAGCLKSLRGIEAFRTRKVRIAEIYLLMSELVAKIFQGICVFVVSR